MLRLLAAGGYGPLRAEIGEAGSCASEIREGHRNETTARCKVKRAWGPHPARSSSGLELDSTDGDRDPL